VDGIQETSRSFGNSVHKNSGIRFEPDPGPGEFETKISRLLDFLEGDVEGILKLVELAGGYIQVATIFRNGNTVLGGHHLGKEVISRMARLHLDIDFDEYAEGNFFKD
jgi:hypothetical protein